MTDPSAPWIFARGHADSIELLAKDADVHYDASARHERQMLVPERMRSVET